MQTELAKTNGTTALHRPQAAPLDFTTEQRKMILDSFLNGATEAEATVLLELARLRRLNPITRQIHFVKRWDGERSCYVWAAQVGIDGFRAIAERTGLYDGQDEPEFEYDKNGGLRLCRVKIYRKDWSRAAVGVAHMAEYAQKKKDGSPTSMWANKPHVMIAKCAEALAFRKAFPEDTSGLYAPEEMPAEERELNPAPQRQAAMPAQSQTGKASAVLKEKLKAQLAKSEVVEPESPAEEPPPPSEKDAPPEAVAEPGSDFEAEATDESVVVPFGRNKGRRLSEVSDQDLAGLIGYMIKQVGDESKSKFREGNQTLLDAARREQSKRQ